MFTIRNNKLGATQFPLQSLGGYAATIFDCNKPQNRATLCTINYRNSARSQAFTETPLEIQEGGIARLSLPDFELASYVEIGGVLYSEAEDYTNLQPGEYFYNPASEIVTIRLWIDLSQPIVAAGQQNLPLFVSGEASTIVESKSFVPLLISGFAFPTPLASGSQTLPLVSTGAAAIVFEASGSYQLPLSNTGNAAIAFESSGSNTLAFGVNGEAAIAFESSGSSSIPLQVEAQAKPTYLAFGESLVPIFNFGINNFEASGENYLPITTEGYATPILTASGLNVDIISNEGQAIIQFVASGSSNSSIGVSGNAETYFAASGNSVIPFIVSGTATTEYRLLLEDGGAILLENGENLLLE